MFVATTLAISLALSPVTTVGACLAVTRGAAPTYAWMAAAGPAEDCPKLEYRVNLVIDATAIGTAAAGVSSRTQTLAEAEIQRLDLMLGADEAQPKLSTLVIKVVPLTGEDEGYTYTIDINHDTVRPIKDGSSVGECRLCTESELLEKVIGSTRALLPKLRAYILDFNNKPCTAVAAEVECETNDQCKDPGRPLCHTREKRCVSAIGAQCQSDAECARSPVGPICSPDSHRCVAALSTPSKGLNGSQKAGIGLIVGGALGLGIGIPLAVRSPSPVLPNEAWTTRSTRPPGIAVAAIGGAALLTGVVLYVLGRRQQTKAKSMAMFGPAFGQGAGTSVGLQWAGRF